MGTRTPYMRMPAKQDRISRKALSPGPASQFDPYNPIRISGRFMGDVMGIKPDSPFGSPGIQHQLRNPFVNPDFYGLQRGIMIPQFDQTPR